MFQVPRTKIASKAAADQRFTPELTFSCHPTQLPLSDEAPAIRLPAVTLSMSRGRAKYPSQNIPPHASACDAWDYLPRDITPGLCGGQITMPHACTPQCQVCRLRPFLIVSLSSRVADAGPLVPGMSTPALIRGSPGLHDDLHQSLYPSPALVPTFLSADRRRPCQGAPTRRQSLRGHRDLHVRVRGRHSEVLRICCPAGKIRSRTEPVHGRLVVLRH